MTPVLPLPSPRKANRADVDAISPFPDADFLRPYSSSAPSPSTLNAQPLPQGTPMAASGTFLADSSPIEHLRDNDDGHDDNEDPHDLSLSSNHVLRASMVDNLVMSLDQFSSTVFDDVPYTPRNRGYDAASSARQRGHTFSSSLSSEADMQDMKGVPRFPDTVPRIPMRNSWRGPKISQRLPSIFGEDEESVRARVYDSQRAAQPGHQRRKKNTSKGGRSPTSSASSSIDLGHLASLSGRLGGPGDRRSRSFDLGSGQRNMRVSRGLTAGDGAPMPIIFQGPEAVHDPLVNTSASPLVRKNSTKSSKSAYAKRGRTGALGTNTLDDPVPQLPTMRSVPALLNTAHDQKLGFSEPVAAPRPGFFRRVFGSSRNPVTTDHHVHAVNKPQYGRSTPVQDEMGHPTTPLGRAHKPVRRTSNDVSANKENHPVSKKTSTFFRRRKKSISTNIPPPLPLTLNSELKSESAAVDGTSPVSSLRAFMVPYLGESQMHSSGHGHGHSRTSSMQGSYTATRPPPTFALPKDTPNRPRLAGHSRNESHGSNRTLKTNSKPGSTLRIPHQDSFLADSSSTEEPSKISPFDGQYSDGEQPDEEVHHNLHDLKLEHTVSFNALPTSTPDPQKSMARKPSWKSEEVSPTTPLVGNPLCNLTNTGPLASPSHSARLLKRLEMDRGGRKDSPIHSLSDVSEYRSAPTTPLVTETPEDDQAAPLEVAQVATLPDPDKLKAQSIFDNVDNEIDSSNAGAWLGEAGADRERIRKAYMGLFDWNGQDILDAFRDLCDRVALKGETQQMDRMVDAFAQRWCECNPNHMYKSSDVVHTICYSLLLLNTDLHLADIGQKMTKNQFVRNALPTVKLVAQGQDTDSTLRANAVRPRANVLSTQDTAETPRQPTRSGANPSQDERQNSVSTISNVDTSADGTPGRNWEMRIESVLRTFYTSISQDPLPLHGAQLDVPGQLHQSSSFLSVGSNMLRRTPSVLSKAHSESNRGRLVGESRSLGARWATKARSRPRLPSAPGFGSSRTSIDEQSTTWSPSMSSTWSRASLGKTLTSMSVDSFNTEAAPGDYQSSIGFANALSQAIIRDDQLELPIDDGPKAGSLLEDDTLELCGAPWAKEGIVKHKCHLEGVDKRSKDRNWTDCFAVIERGWMRLFSFSSTAKSLRNKARQPKAGAVVGGGNWQDNAEEVWKFMLRHTIASSLPPPGYSKARPYVWALSLPTGAVHLFSVGTPDIVKEFVSSANFWSARLSKEPMMGGISNMEYGWSDAVVNRSLISSDSQNENNSTMNPRPSTQMSMRSSLDYVGGGARAKLPGDRVHISDWTPPQQSMFASQLMEVDQLKALQTYVSNVEDELQRHNELRGPMLLAFSSKHPNSTKAMNNWEKKSSYLLREIVKFRTYIDALQHAQATKDRIYKMRQEEDEARRVEMDSRVVTGQPIPA
ncbi:hypothetical protein HRR83_008815 [Exophiala dermatitidis]|uniref:SEC7 domain-containing protein n=2 Tax=Exophiala dermatitidis TaxID=5970 RepID=H6BXD9_EXODN|nr:uncharacterized protein HMPREF1120_03509 [Exophiala dermatitidis NIH/UT8656]KAJ4503703.1 hypothetical protein HRR73_009008 [Exophiala dermatitidis]EHY55370.1 hypothetical protein HMPREF1120_03509 [Exophiala dermatitidis NIH/UT8656]KAJ4506249.1 hypothetical protein HRR75_007104 [Exophiala dermatitidis]KAJ4508343.1 hypothetical protein HRR74_007742 [Exophiala dermatitidis]KAJ4533439.1 hypothetical protein HRR77_008601 [Exophiala dermatitidis]